MAGVSRISGLGGANLRASEATAPHVQAVRFFGQK